MTKLVLSAQGISRLVSIVSDFKSLSTMILPIAKHIQYRLLPCINSPTHVLILDNTTQHSAKLYNTTLHNATQHNTI